MRAEDSAIIVKDVAKTFTIPLDSSSGIKQHIVNFFGRKRGQREFKALKGVSFEIKKGEFFGIVGRNGSGKSTLLKMLAGIYVPDRGAINVEGSLTPFIELGVGFNPELTGKENVYLNGALLGFSQLEMEQMYDDIVNFAELHDFMEERLKNYSSGMQVRLAFSIAIRAKSDILLLDEVLAVGDSNFQRKCFDYFNELKKEKKTVILVTHDMSAVERFCDRALLLNNGIVDIEGSPDEVTKRYSDLNISREALLMKKKQDNAVQKEEGDMHVEATILDHNNQATNGINARETPKLTISLAIDSKVAVDEVRLGIIVANISGTPIFATNSKIDRLKIKLKKGKNKVDVEVDNIFSNGEYSVAITFKSYDDGSIIYYSNDNIAHFIVGGREHEHALTSPKYTIHAG